MRAGVNSGARRETAHGEDDHRQDARQMQPFGDQPDRERAAELHDDRGRDVVDPDVEVEDNARECDREHEAAERDEEQHRHDAPAGKKSGRRRADGDAVDQQRAGIVEEALPFQDDEQAVRRAELLQHRGRRRGIGRRDDRAERDGGGPRQSGHERARHECDRRNRQDHRAEGQAGNGAPVGAEIAGGGVERRVEQHRGDEERERELRIEGQVRRARHERERGTGQRRAPDRALRCAAPRPRGTRRPAAAR
jgi:hypothetical protein